MILVVQLKGVILVVQLKGVILVVQLKGVILVVQLKCVISILGVHVSRYTSHSISDTAGISCI